MACNDFKNRMSIAANLAGNATELSRKTGISRRAIGTYLSGTSDPTRERLIAIAKVAGVSLEWLATGYGGGEQIEGNQDIRLAEVASQARIASEDQQYDELPVAYYEVSSECFASMDLLDLENTKALYFSPDLLESLDFVDYMNLRAVCIVGKRVTPLGVGNILLIDCDDDVMKQKEPGVYLLQKNGKVQVSIAYPYEAKYIRIISYQGDDTSEILDSSRSDVVVLGRVIWSCGKV